MPHIFRVLCASADTHPSIPVAHVPVCFKWQKDKGKLTAVYTILRFSNILSCHKILNENKILPQCGGLHLFSFIMAASLLPNIFFPALLTHHVTPTVHVLHCITHTMFTIGRITQWPQAMSWTRRTQSVYNDGQQYGMKHLCWAHSHYKMSPPPPGTV